MESTKDWLNELKLKFSVGQQGNDAIGSNLYMDTYLISNSNDKVATMLYSKGNPNITWETNTNLNLGVEFTMFDNRLRGGLEYFYRKTTDMLSIVYVPKSEGYTQYYSNVGSMVNQGVEFDIAYDIFHTKDFVWNVNLNATHYTNEITKLYAENKKSTLDGHAGYTSGDYFYGEGLPIYTWRLPKYAGVDAEGNAMWYKTDDQGVRTTTTNHEEASYYACGDPTPDLYGGFGTTVTFKGFDLSVNFSYSIGGQVFDYGYQTLMHSPNSSDVGTNFHKDMLKAWSETNKSSNIPRLQFGDTDQNLASDRFLTNGSWLSLNDINFGYTFPKVWISKLGLTKLRVYVAADNVALWTKRKGLDPRTSYAGSPGIENYSFVRTISGGITLNF